MLTQAIYNAANDSRGSKRRRFRSDSDVKFSHRCGGDRLAGEAEGRVEKELEEAPAASPRACSGLSARRDRVRQRIRRVRQLGHSTIPPYQEESEGNQRNPPIYNLFMDEAYKVSGKVELITPARFLSDAGQTPKEWNRKMLHDPHLKVMEFEQDASTVFSGVEIKGGVAVTYRDEESNFGAIETFVPYEPLRSVLSKVQATDADVLSGMVTGAVPYKFTDKAKKDHPEYVELMGKSCDLRTNVLDNLYDKLFFRNKRDDSAYAAIYGLFNKKRECLWIERQYIDVPENFGGYKVLLSKANGAGTYGEKLSSFVIAAKGVGHTQSFVSMGNFETEAEAENLVKYLETKFARSLLGILKVTQDISPRVWSLVPVQDFTDSSDIDWSKSTSEIDQQLYAKYDLSDEEINFIETHVKEMD